MWNMSPSHAALRRLAVKPLRLNRCTSRDESVWRSINDLFSSFHILLSLHSRLMRHFPLYLIFFPVCLLEFELTTLPNPNPDSRHTGKYSVLNMETHLPYLTSTIFVLNMYWILCGHLTITPKFLVIIIIIIPFAHLRRLFTTAFDSMAVGVCHSATKALVKSGTDWMRRSVRLDQTT